MALSLLEKIKMNKNANVPAKGLFSKKTADKEEVKEEVVTKTEESNTENVLDKVLQDTGVIEKKTPVKAKVEDNPTEDTSEMDTAEELPLDVDINCEKVSAKDEAEKEPVKTEDKAETEVEDKPEVEVKEESSVAAEPVKVEPVEEEKTKRRKRRSKKDTQETETNANAEDTVEAVTDNNDVTIVEASSISLSEAMALFSPALEEDFVKFIEEERERIENIKITADMNSTVLGIALEELSICYDEVLSPYYDIKSFFETLTNKDIGHLTVARTIGGRNGKSESERKYNGLVTALAYKAKGMKEPVNLLEITREVNVKLNKLQALVTMLDTKKQLLITVNGKLKLEQ